MSDIPSSTPPRDEVHIAGVLVHVRPLSLLQASRAIDAIDGAEVFQSSADGKVVVILEAGSTQAQVELMDTLRRVPGVLNVALVYQHAESASSMQEEMQA